MNFCNLILPEVCKLSQRSYGELYVDEFLRLYNLAKANESRSLPMVAIADTKQPRYPHKYEHYDSFCEDLVKEMQTNKELVVDRVEREQSTKLNILADDLYVIDLDSPEAIDYFNQIIKPKFEDEFATCPMQKISKGFHYFFVRPTVAS